MIVGGYDEAGNADPSMITFVYKTGFEDKKRAAISNLSAEMRRRKNCRHLLPMTLVNWSHSLPTCHVEWPV